MQLGVLRHLALHEDGCGTWTDAHRQPVHDRLEGVLLDVCRGLVVGGKRVVVRHEKEAGVLVLQTHPVLQRTMVVAYV